VRRILSARPNSHLLFLHLSNLPIRLSPLRAIARRRERNRERISAMRFMTQDEARAREGNPPYGRMRKLPTRQSEICLRHSAPALPLLPLEDHQGKNLELTSSQTECEFAVVDFEHGSGIPSSELRHLVFVVRTQPASTKAPAHNHHTYPIPATPTIYPARSYRPASSGDALTLKSSQRRTETHRPLTAQPHPNADFDGPGTIRGNNYAILSRIADHAGTPRGPP